MAIEKKAINKPEPPSIEEMIEDVKSAGPDDILFCIQEFDDLHIEDNLKDENANEMYKNLCKLIKCHKGLQSGQDELRQKVEELKVLKNSINELLASLREGTDVEIT